jgi:putative peptide zinc metalloprotease protein
MQSSLFSPRWYRISGLRPQLRAQVELRRQDQRGTAWFLLIDESCDDVRRLNRAAYEFIGRCDGTQTVQQIWDQLLNERPEETMGQDDVVQLLAALHDRGLIAFDTTPDIEAIFHSRERKRTRKRLQGVNPLAFRLALGDPSKLLARLAGLGAHVFSARAFWLWSVAMLVGATVATLHASELFAHGARLLASPGTLFLTWAMYPLIKAVHELAHGLAVQRWGGQVRQAGLTLLLLTPVPFVNASAADAFRHRHQRAIVSAAGIMAELAVAALALFLWLIVQPGRVQDLALLAMLIGAVSTVLVNGNPLLRFDGYYLLCDLLDLRNLGIRSATCWSQLLSRRMLGATPPRPLETLPGERPWLLAYAPLATFYRCALALGIGLWIGSHSALFGALVGGFMLVTSVGRPALAALRAVVAGGAGGSGSRRRPLRRGIAVAVGLIALVAALPLPFSTLAQGVVWLPERAQLRAGTDGIIAAFAVESGQLVTAGTLIATLADERLAVEHAALLADATDLEVSMFQAITSDPDKVPALREKLAYSRAEAARNTERLAQLQVRAQADGMLVIPRQPDQLGSFRKKGELIGHLVTGDPLTVRIALPQEQADLVRSGPRQVGVRLAEEGYRLRSGAITRDMDGAVARLPSAALGDRHGGDIAVDGDDKDGLTTRQPVVLMDVEVASVRSDRVGARALVRFDHGTLPLAQQMLRKLQQLVLQHFNPAG